MTNTNTTNSSTRIRTGRYIFLVLAWIMVVCIALQTLLAGMSIFNDPSHWQEHIVFVRFFEFLPFLMIIFAFVGKMPKGTAWLSFSIYALIFLQYTTANVSAIGAVHPVIALVLILVTVYLAKRATRTCFRESIAG